MKLYCESVDFHLLSSLKDVRLNDILASKGFDGLFWVILRHRTSASGCLNYCVCVCVCVCVVFVFTSVCLFLADSYYVCFFLSRPYLSFFFSPYFFSFFQWKEHVCSVTQSYPTCCDPMECSLHGPLCPWGFSKQEY